MDDFEPRNTDVQIDEIIPVSPSDTDLSAARDQCASTVDALSKDVRGIREKAAERYLLRYEFGYSPKILAEEFDVTSPTITKQTSSAKEKILTYPKLAQIIGKFRSERADLKQPIVDDHPLWEGKISMDSTEAHARVGFYPGSYRVPYSWKFALNAEAQYDDMIRHLKVHYLIDKDCGVFLKRSLRGFSYNHWKRPPYFQSKRNYTVYPLPNESVPNQDGTLTRAVEYHVVFDIKNAFENIDWQLLELQAQVDGDSTQSAAASGLPEVLSDRLKHEKSDEAIFDYTQEIHIRDNTEQLLRLYPLTEISQIPLDTVELLWNGDLKHPMSDETNSNDVKDAIETSQISRQIGRRNR